MCALVREGSRRLLFLFVATVIAGVATAGDEAHVSEADRASLTLGPNDVPNFRSAGHLNPPLLEPGIDVSRLPLESAGGEAFPSGRQFVFVRPFVPRQPGGVAQAVRDLDLDRFRELVDGAADALHVVFVKATPDGRTLEMTGTDFTIDALWEAPDTRPLEGPWTVWVDARNVVTQMTHANLALGETTMLAPPRPHYVCVDDGRSLGSVDGFWPSLDDAHLQALYEACVDGSWGDAWSPIAYGTGAVVPPFRLVDEEGGELQSEDLMGAPFALLALAPVAGEVIEFVPGRDAPMFRAIEPEPAVRLEQVRSLLAEAVPDMRIVVLALPYASDDRFWTVDEVTGALSGLVDVPVYRDASGHMVSALAQYLGNPSVLVVVDAQGRLVDSFSDWMRGEVGMDWMGPPSIERVLRPTIGWGSP